MHNEIDNRSVTLVSGQTDKVIMCSIPLVLCLIVFITSLIDLAIELNFKQGKTKQ